jgi:hypothetical protein
MDLIIEAIICLEKDLIVFMFRIYFERIHGI